MINLFAIPKTTPAGTGALNFFIAQKFETVSLVCKTQR